MKNAVCYERVVTVFKLLKIYYKENTYYKEIFVGSIDRGSSQQLQMWFSGHIFGPNLLRRLSRLLFLLRWNKYGAKQCLKNHIPFDF